VWLVIVEDSVGASPTYFSCEACRQSRSCLSLACVADCWHVARSAMVVMPNVVVLHDNIGAFVSVFGRFPSNRPVKFSSSLTMKMASLLPRKKKDYFSIHISVLKYTVGLTTKITSNLFVCST
jgi:hypothetical protein